MPRSFIPRASFPNNKSATKTVALFFCFARFSPDRFVFFAGILIKKQSQKAKIILKNRTKIKADGKKERKWIKRLGVALLVLLFIITVVTAGLVGYVATHIDYAADERLFENAKGNRTTRIYAPLDHEGEGDPPLSHLGDLSLSTKKEERGLSRLPHAYRPTELVGERIYGGEKGIFVAYADIPDDLKNALVAIEDHRFFEHRGVDWLRTVKAAFNQIFRFDRRFGASTITQQLIKNISSDNEITLSRKLREIFRALHLEKNHSKEEILELYLNILPMGNGCVGVGAAADYYYGKSVGELTLAECASLAAITNLPSKYDPIANPAENCSRKEVILGEMLERGMIGQREYERAMGEKPTVLEENAARDDTPHGWYTETVITDVIADLMSEYGLSQEMAVRMVYGGGLSIYTAQSPAVQETLEDYFSDLSHFRGTGGMQCAMVVLDPTSGDLLGIVGGVGKKQGSRLFNYATDALRAPGSAIKPLSVYAPAIEEGIVTWSSVFDDVPLSFTENTAWPHNSPKVYSGLCDLYTAVVQSKNTVAVRVLGELGIERSYHYLTRKLGLHTILRGRYLESGDKVTDLAPAPLALGQLSDGVSVRALTGAYAALASGGVYHPSRSYVLVLDKNGEVLLEKKAEGIRAFSESTASIVTELLRGVVEEGTAKRITLPEIVDTAGKTGTSGEGRDKWFVGYTPYAVAGIWCGYDDGNTAVSGAAQNLHLTVWDDVMHRLHHRLAGVEGERHFSLAPGLVHAAYCRDSGKTPCEACRKDPRNNRISTGYFAAGTEPHGECGTHVLVDYDFVGGGVATPSCPQRRVEKVGLIRVENRAFPKQIYVTDAQYVYRQIGEDDELPDTDKAPFFATLLPKGQFVGISKTENGRQFNAICLSHNGSDFSPEGEEERRYLGRGFHDFLSRYFSFGKNE